MKRRIKTIWNSIQKNFQKKHIIIVVGLFTVLATIVALWPKTVPFSFASTTCVNQIALLPNLLKTDKTDIFQIKTKKKIHLFGYPILSREACVIPEAPPEVGEVRVGLSPLGGPLFKRAYIIQVGHLPQPKLNSLTQPLPATKPLQLPLSSTDRVFTYGLKANKQEAACTSADKQLVCDLAALDLSQGREYAAVLTRNFKNQEPETIAEETIKTLKATKITKASIKNNKTIFNKPRRITFSTDKKLETAEVTLHQIRGKKKNLIPSKISLLEDGFAVELFKDLPREAFYRVTVASVEAVDGSMLEERYQLSFKTSGGPKVTGINIGKTGVLPGSAVVLQLDQPLKADLEIAQFIAVSGDPTAVRYGTSQVIITLGNPGRCKDFSITLKKGIPSRYNITSSKDWSYTARTRCHDIRTVGYSVRGRPINAYYFGSGGTSVLFTGGIHGNELSSNYIMNAWINELETRAREIPSGRQIIVVPGVNPDGLTTGSRNNARGVNLNRNFPTANWVSDINTGSGTHKGGGGSSAGSEPETKVLMSLAHSLKPRLTITYHSLGSLVNSNDVGIASSAGPEYARIAGYRFIPSSQTTATFGFEMTGTYERWLKEQGRSAFLIELNTHTGQHFWQNRNAMWTAIKR